MARLCILAALARAAAAGCGGRATRALSAARRAPVVAGGQWRVDRTGLWAGGRTALAGCRAVAVDSYAGTTASGHFRPRWRAPRYRACALRGMETTGRFARPQITRNHQ